MTLHDFHRNIQLSHLCDEHLSEEQCWDFLATYMAPLTATESTPQGRITEEGIGWARSKRGSGGASPRNFFSKLGAVRTLLVASETRSVRAAT